MVSNTEKPTNQTPVLAWDGKRWVRSMWVPRYALCHNYDDDAGDWSDYNPADDTDYWPEGWYELQSHGGEEKYWHLTDGATHWMPLPSPPKEQA